MASAQLISNAVGIRNVLIGTDFSHCSSLAIEYGLELAQSNHAKAHIIYVVPRDEFLLADPETFIAARDAARRDILELRQRLERRFAYHEGQDYELLIFEGHIAECILRCVNERRIDLVIMGTHGHAGINRFLMGSIAERVFRASPVPVLTIGPHLKSAHRHYVPRHIMLAAEFTPACEAAARFACALAREHEATVTVLHVIDERDGHATAHPERMKAPIAAELAAFFEESLEGTRFECRVETGPVVPTIIKATTDLEADLLVTGVRPSPPLLQRFIWPNAYAIVRDSPCPVVTVRGTSQS